MKTALETSRILVATVKATGRRYVLQRRFFGKTDADSRAYTWGEVVSFSIRRPSGAVHGIKYDGTKTFVLDAVTVEEVDSNAVLFNALFAQTKEVRRSAGHVIVGNTDYGTPQQMAERREFNQAIAKELHQGEVGKAVVRAINRTLWT